MKGVLKIGIEMFSLINWRLIGLKVERFVSSLYNGTTCSYIFIDYNFFRTGKNYILSLYDKNNIIRPKLT